MEPVISFNMFNSMTYMTNAVDTFVEKLLIDLQPNKEQCQEWLDKSVGVVTAMLPHIGYENSAMIAKEAYNTGKPVRQVILEKGLISKEKMEKILSPKEMTTPGIAG
jgi:aspartate ammonia-lyase